MSAKLIFLAGSARKDSVNKKLAKAAAEKAKELGAEASFIDLKDYEMPIFCEDHESENGIPDAAHQLIKLFKESDGFLIASPEYNSTFSALLKNTFDWMSRISEEGQPAHPATRGKIVALMSASPGPLGGIRGLTPLRLWLSSIGAHVIPNQFALGGAYGQFDDEGNFTGDTPFFEITLKEFVETAEALK